METKNNKCYPVFMPNQILTNVHLNRMREYLDEENRLTRNKLIGFGIVCGLKVSLNSDGNIVITKGMGITTDGYLLTLNETTYASYRIYSLSADDKEILNLKGDRKTLIELLPVESTSEKTQSSTNNFSKEQIISPTTSLGKIITKGKAVTKINLLKDISKDSSLTNFKDKIVILFLELKDETLESCTGSNCDNKGMRKICNLKVLLANQKDFAEDKKDKNSLDSIKEEINMPELCIKGFSLFTDLKVGEKTAASAGEIDKLDHINDRYKNIFSTIVDRIINALNACYNSYKTHLQFLQDEYAENPFTNITGQFKKIILYSSVDHQYRYDFFCELIKAYCEFRDQAFELVASCMPDNEKFPRHLFLGLVDDSLANKSGQYRYPFIQAPVYKGKIEKIKEVKILFKRLIKMIDCFEVPDDSKLEIKITPSKEKKLPLSEWSIPYYYFKNDVETKINEVWNYSLLSRGRANKIHSYFAYKYNSTDENVINPLAYNHDEYPFLRIEGIHGKGSKEVMAKLDELKKIYNLPFKTVELNLEKNIDDAEIVNNKIFYDLQEEYFLHIRKLNYILSNIPEYFERINSLGKSLLVEIDTVLKSHGIGVNFTEELATVPLQILDFIKSTTGSLDYFEFGTKVDAKSPSTPIKNSAPGSTTVNVIRHDSIKDFSNASPGEVKLTSENIKDIVFELYKDVKPLPESITEFDFEWYKKIYKKALLLVMDFLINDQKFLEKAFYTFKISQTANGIAVGNLILSLIVKWVYNLSDNFFYTDLFRIYFGFLKRKKYLVENNFSIFSNFIKKNPGIQHLAGVYKGGTFIVVCERGDEIKKNVSEASTVVADFSLPYLCCTEDYDIPIYDTEDSLKDIHINPFARPDFAFTVKNSKVTINVLNSDESLFGGNIVLVEESAVEKEEALEKVEELRKEEVLEKEVALSKEEISSKEAELRKEVSIGKQEVLGKEVTLGKEEISSKEAELKVEVSIGKEELLEKKKVIAKEGEEVKEKEEVDKNLISEKGGRITIMKKGEIIYSPPKNFTGKDSFTYTIKNKTNGLTDQGIVTVYVFEEPIKVPDISASTDNLHSINITEFENMPLPSGSELKFTDTDGKKLITENGNIFEILEEKVLDEKAADVKVPEVKELEGKALEGKVLDEKVADVKIPEAKELEGKAVEGKVLDEKVADVKIPEAKELEGKAVEGKVLDEKVIDVKIPEEGVLEEKEIMYKKKWYMRFIPNKNFKGLESCGYKVVSGYDMGEATVNVKVIECIDAVDDKVSTTSDKPIMINVLDNDIHPIGSQLSFAKSKENVLVTDKGNKFEIVELKGEYYLFFTPLTTFGGEDSCTYTIIYGDRHDEAVVNVSVKLIVPLKADNDYEETNANSPVRIRVMENDTFPTKTELKFSDTDKDIFITNKENQFAIEEDRQGQYLLFTPRRDFEGEDSCTYKLVFEDRSAAAVVRVKVNPPQVELKAEDDNVAAPINTSVIIRVMENDIYPPKTELRFADTDSDILVTQQKNQFVIKEDIQGQYLLFTPYRGFYGEDTCTYKLVNKNQFTTAIVRINVVPPQVEIKAVDDNAETTVNNPIMIRVLENDTFPVDTELRFADTESSTLVTKKQNQFSIALDNQGKQHLYFAPFKDFEGEDSCTYKLIYKNQSATAVARINVKHAEIKLQAINDNYQFSTISREILLVLNNDIYDKNKPITLEFFEATPIIEKLDNSLMPMITTSNGARVFLVTQQSREPYFIYLPSKIGTDQFKYQIKQGSYSASATVQVELKYIQISIVQGTVTANNDLLPAVNVVVKGTAMGTVTDIEGKYVIKSKDDLYGKTLQFNSTGYTAKVILIDRAVINCELVSISINKYSDLTIKGDESLNNIIVDDKNKNFISDKRISVGIENSQKFVDLIKSQSENISSDLESGKVNEDLMVSYNNAVDPILEQIKSYNEKAALKNVTAEETALNEINLKLFETNTEALLTLIAKKENDISNTEEIANFLAKDIKDKIDVVKETPGNKTGTIINKIVAENEDKPQYTTVMKNLLK